METQREHALWQLPMTIPGQPEVPTHPCFLTAQP